MVPNRENQDISVSVEQNGMTFNIHVILTTGVCVFLLLIVLGIVITFFVMENKRSSTPQNALVELL